MEPGSSSEPMGKAERKRGPRRGAAIGSVEPKISAFVPRRDHNPRELRSWAKRTGFVSNFSGETATSGSVRNDSAGFGLETGFDGRGGGGSSPKIEIDPVLGRTKPSTGIEIEPALVLDMEGNGSGNGNGHGVTPVASAAEPKIIDDEKYERDVEMNYPDGEEPVHGGWGRPSAMKIGLRENPGFVPLMYYGLQHYLSLAGSLIFTP
ncbi:nucleobase-ascorbate transporter 11 [Prunus yedoensis var. nudiflora]|uniref:Nucleobase-ascorbate transporter 11 n=1 Tax=Prunus yedoensis var. nudiflora TaxID=2094558 RepID=A0A314UR35_PRUYE|nr:nucleobase-ascorbate transporter 11 [Prunus yedoensis var. nudiflora]